MSKSVTELAQIEMRELIEHSDPKKAWLCNWVGHRYVNVICLHPVEILDDYYAQYTDEYICKRCGDRKIVKGVSFI